MTVNASTRENRYITDGVVSIYNYTFRIVKEDDLVVIYQESVTDTLSVLVRGTDYTVTQVGNDSGGNVVLIDPDGLPNSGEGHLLIYAKEADDQLVDFTVGDGVGKQSQQSAADKRARVSQQSRLRVLAKDHALVAATDTGSAFIAQNVIVPASLVRLEVLFIATATAPGLVNTAVNLRERGFTSPSPPLFQSSRSVSFNAQAGGDTQINYQTVWVPVDSGQIEYEVASGGNSLSSTVTLLLTGWYD